MKEEYNEKIMSLRNPEKDVARAAEGLKPIIGMMLQMVDGKDEDVPVLSRKLAEKLLPVVNQATRELYADLLTTDQLAALSEFYEDNPWYYEANTDMTEAISRLTQERATPMLDELFNEYLPEEQEEEEEEVNPCVGGGS